MMLLEVFIHLNNLQLIIKSEKMAKKKKNGKRLTRTEEFDLMKMVLDKFLWIGFGVMFFGLLRMFAADFVNGMLMIIAGAIVLLLFLVIIVKEYEILVR